MSQDIFYSKDEIIKKEKEFLCYLKSIKERVSEFNEKIREIQKKYYDIFQKKITKPHEGFRPTFEFKLLCN